VRVAVARRAVLSSLLLAVALALAAPVAAVPEPTPADVAGTWGGAKLRCQKEESKLLRCGTPAPFSITFAPDGTGTTTDQSLPERFTWRLTGPGEITLVPQGGGEALKLFGVELDEGMLSFQAYVYLPTEDPNAPAETRYIHYIFDVNRQE